MHKHLFCDRSQVLKDEYELSVKLNKSKPTTVSWDDHFLGKDMLEAYAGFLYGQPLCPSIASHDEIGTYPYHWDLVALYELMVLKEDFDAADAALDILRSMIHDIGDELDDPFLVVTHDYLEFDEPRGRLLVDFMVQEGDGSRLRKWMKEFNGAHDPTVEGDLDEAIARKFTEEAERKRAGKEPPDLMERCRYHWHVARNTPCYLDKR